MGKASLIQNQFNAGELSPRMYGRTDFQKYNSGLEILENFICTPQGSAKRRGGTKFIKEVKTSANDIRLVAFEFSVTQAYILEFGNNYIRVYKDQGAVLDSAQTITGVTKANPGVVTTSGSHGFSNGDEVFIDSVGGMTEVNNKFFVVAGVTATTFQLTDVDGNNVDTTSYTTYTTGGNASPIVEITTTYTMAELFELGFTQSADTLYIVHKDHAPAKLTRTSHTNWTLSTISFTATPSTWAANNYPQAVTFFEQRLWFAGTPNEPQTLWGSKSASFEDFTKTPVADDMSVEYTIASDQVNAIRWMSPGDVLTIGTAGGEFIAAGSSIDTAITPTNIRIVRQSTHGSKQVSPLRIADVTLFVQRAGHKLRQLGYIFESDSYQSPDLTILADHVSQSAFKELAYQQEQFSVVWAVHENGTLSAMTYLRDQQVVGWHRHPLGGTDVSVESIAVIPGVTDAVDEEVWVVVERTINGATRKYLEIITSGLNDAGNKEDSFFVDSGLTYSGASTTTISGLNHLEGETVSILGNGHTLPDETVNGGSVTLDHAVTKAHIGLGYTSKLRTLRVDRDEQEGTIQGKTKRISKINIRLNRSLGLKVGPESSKLDTIFFRSSVDPMDASPPLFTGDKEILFRSGYDKAANIEIHQDQPLPTEILAIMPIVQTNG